MATSFFSVVHDLRRTYAVHALTSGIPLPRLQRLLGHRTPAMSLRYAHHAPEPHGDDEAARIEASMAGVANREVQAARELLKIVEAQCPKFAHSTLEVRATLVLTCCPAISGAVAKW